MRRRRRDDRGGGSDFVGFIILFPLVLFPFVFAVQVFMYYQASSAAYSSAYLTLRAAETYYAPALADPSLVAPAGPLRGFFDANMSSQGYATQPESITIENGDAQFFELDIDYSVPIQYLTASGDSWNLWGSTTSPPTLPVRIRLLGRKVVR